MIGRFVDVTADLRPRHGQPRRRGRDRVASARVGRQLTITDPAHVADAAALRKAFKQVRGYRPLEAVETRELASYDDIFGTGQVA